MSSENKKLKLNYPQTFLIGFGFLASSLAWSIYNSQVPLILSERFLMSGTLIGTIMTIDNFFGVIFQPLVGAWSDNTRSSIGRRMPWIAIGLPLCALLFSIIPLQGALWSFMLFVILFNLIMSLWRSPVISLMPDVTPRPLRSHANGIINLMGGLGSVVAFLVGGYLSDIGDHKFYAFFMGTLVMLASLLVLLFFVREPDAISYREEKGLKIPDNIANRWGMKARESIIYGDKLHDEAMGIKADIENGEEVPASENIKKAGGIQAFLALQKAEKRSLVFILIAILAWFMGYNGIETFFTLFATSTYGMSGGQATMMLTGFSLSFLVFAIPAGLIGQKLGRKKTILLGLIGIIVLFIPILSQPSQLLLQILLIGGGMFWACININSLPMVLEFSSTKTVGTFTGYYYLFSFTAAIISPILFGVIKDIVGNYSLLFAYAVICFAIACFSMFNVRHGDAVVK